MQEIARELLWFLPWCWGINISLNVLWYFFKPRFPILLKLDRSFDCGVTFFDGHPLLGTSTTWGGLIQVTILGILGEMFAPEHSFFLLAVLVFFGHALGSFIKRRCGLPRGVFLFGVDHIDYVFLAGVCFLLLDKLSFIGFCIALVLTLILTPLLTFLSYLFHLRTEKL